MAIQKVVVVDGNNLIVRIDRGVAGRSVTDVVPVEIDNSLYLEFYFSDGTTETVGPVGTIQYLGQSPIVVTGSTISLSTVPVNLGGTGATTASGARTNLGLGTISTQDASAVAITGGSITGITDLAIADGGTGASTSSGARTNLGLGTIATQDSSNVSITGGSITGITDLAIADGGTGASTASGARSNLGLGTAATLNAGVANGVATLDSGGTVPLSQIPASIQGGVSYQGTWNASTNTPTLSSGVGSKGYYYVVSVAGNTNLDGITSWNVGDWAIYSGTAWQKIDNTDAVTSVNGYTGTVVLTNTDISGFGTMSTQNANNVSITGGSITGITDLAVADGGTGASTASGARTNLGAAASGANSDITSMSGITGGISTVDYVKFDTTYTTALTAGQLGWDGNNTLGLGMAGGNVVQKIGEDQFYYIKASSAITKGQVVMFTGSVGASGVVTGAPAASVTDGSYIMGIAAESIAVNGFGLIQFEGTLRGFDTSAFTDGDILWYNPSVTGGLTATKPSAPYIKVQMCAVINSGNAGSGSVLVRVSAGSVLGGTDSNVQFGTLANGNLIQYDSTLQYWKNVAPSDVSVTTFSGGTTGLTPSTATAGAVTLAGTLGISNGGTGQTTANAAFNALAPDQTGNSGKYLTTDGSNTSWATNPLGTVTSVSGTGTVSGISLSGTVTTSGSLTLGGSLDLSAPPAIGGTTPAAGAFTTLSASSDLTLSGGTANGVLYLNGSKVATSGSALTFDGTNLGMSNGASVSIGGNVSLYGDANQTVIRGRVTNGTIFQDSAGSEQMRLTSTGLGIGASSPNYSLTSYKAGAVANYLQVTSGATGAGSGNGLLVGVDASGNSVINAQGAINLYTYVAGVLRTTIDSSGNLSIGTSSPFSNPKLSVYNSATLSTGGDGGGNGVLIAASTGAASGGQLVVAGSDTAAIDKGGAIVFAGKWDTATNDIAQWAKIVGYKENATNNNYSAYLGFYTRANGTSQTEKMRLDSSGNLGLGVTPSAWYPSFKVLELGSGSLVYPAASSLILAQNAYNNASSAWIYKNTDLASFYAQQSGVHKWYNAPSGTAGDPITFTQAMTLAASGGLSVGSTTDAGAGNILVGNGKLIVSAGSGDAYSARLSCAYNYPNIDTYLDSYAGTAYSGQIIFRTNTNDGAMQERARINSSGNLLVADTATAYSAKLYVNGSIAARNGGVDGTFQNAFVAGYSSNYNEKNIIQTAVSGIGTGSGFRFSASDGAGLSSTTTVLDLTRTQTIFYTGGSERARIDSSGTLCVNTTNPAPGSGAIQVAPKNSVGFGADASAAYYSVANYYNGSFAGGLYVTTGATALITSSDYRLKNTIQPMSDALAKVAQLKPVTYKWNSDGSDGEGFIAHELAEIFPKAVIGEKDAVDENGNPKYQGIDKLALVATLTAAIQEQQALIQQLSARVAQLESN